MEPSRVLTRFERWLPGFSSSEVAIYASASITGILIAGLPDNFANGLVGVIWFFGSFSQTYRLGTALFFDEANRLQTSRVSCYVIAVLGIFTVSWVAALAHFEIHYRLFFLGIVPAIFGTRLAVGKDPKEDHDS